MLKKILIFHSVISILIALVNCSNDWSPDESPDKWNSYSRNRLNQMLERSINKNLAKNLILYLGDGMGVSTVTAGRILKGQLNGNNGEEHVTFIESLDHLALSKTYNIDAQTADSAGTGTAFHTGVKTRIGSIGVDGRAFDCKSSLNSKLESVLKWAHFAGKSTGIVTTARATHATPAGAYANVPNRDWETYDNKYFNKTHFNEGCRDIADQLVGENSYINLVLGGGRRKLLRNTDSDYKNASLKGDRADNRNLIDEWKQTMNKKNLKHKFIWNMTDFMALKPNQHDHILGLLSWDHMDWEYNKMNDNREEPTIVQMTLKAIELLSTNPNGFYLLVEGGKIDHGHHASNSQKALTEFVAFDNSIAVGLNNTSINETLIIGTADHSHVFTIGGYNTRGGSIFGLNHNMLYGHGKSSDNLTYTPLLYGNGPGKLKNIRDYNLTEKETEHIDYLQESAVYMKSETHGGEDVGIYASGPMSYLFDGTVEQSYIAYVMAYSACIGPYNMTNDKMCTIKRGIVPNSAMTINAILKYHVFTLITILGYLYLL